jgi:translation initiation factor 1
MTRLLAGTPWDRPPTCDRCGRLVADCNCPPETPAPERLPPGKQTARLAIERRAKGKQVTVIRGLTADDNDLPELLSRLKTVCGAGGSIDGETLEIQGDHRDRLRAVLANIGYRVKG